MPEPGKPPDQGTLTRHLLGLTSGVEADALDERSVADDEFAAELEAAENELVDGYLRGSLSPDTMTRFESHYLPTVRGQRKLRFARALRQHRRTRAPRRAVPAWVFAAAAALVLSVSGVLLYRAGTLDRGGTDVPRTVRGGDVSLPPAQQEVAQPEPPRAAPSVLAFTLLPATRGAAPPSEIAVPAGTTEVQLRLELETDDFSVYEAALRDLATDRVVRQWRDLRSRTSSGARIVAIPVQASLLDSRAYAVELTGRAKGATPDLLGSYPFRVIQKP